MRSSASPHAFMGVTEHGLASIVKTKGNSHTHIILRGGKTPNYGPEFVASAKEELLKAMPDRHPSIMIECVIHPISPYSVRLM